MADKDSMMIGAGTVLAILAILFPIAIKAIMVVENRLGARNGKATGLGEQFHTIQNHQDREHEAVLTHRQ